MIPTLTLSLFSFCARYASPPLFLPPVCNNIVVQFLLLLPPPSPVSHDHLSKRRTRPPDPTQAGYRPLPGPCSPDTHPPKSHRPASPRPTSRPARLVPHQKPGSWRAARRTSRTRRRRCGRGTTGARRGRKRFRARRLRGLGICLPAISCTSKGIRNKLREESLRERRRERERERTLLRGSGCRAGSKRRRACPRT